MESFEFQVPGFKFELCAEVSTASVSGRVRDSMYRDS